MKTRNLLLTGLIGLGMLSACSNEDDINAIHENGENSYLQIAVSIAGNNAATTKVEGSTGDIAEGTAAENAIKSMTVIATTDDGIVSWVKSDVSLKKAEGDEQVRATEPFLAPIGSYKIYIIANTTSNTFKAYTKGNNITEVLEDINSYDLTNTNNGFIMTNATAPGITKIETPTVTEFDDDGNSIQSSERKVVRVEATIQRVVGKVTFDQPETTLSGADVEDDNIASVDLTGVQIINLNKKMNLIQDTQTATNYPTNVTSWYYPEDPNYNVILGTSTDYTTKEQINSWIDNNFSQTSATSFETSLSTATFYAPENTMIAQAQQNGQTTGIVYKTKVTISDGKYTTLAATGTSTDAYSQKFQQILNETSKDDIEGNIFTTDANPAATFYTYNGLVFKNRNAAALYQAIAESGESDTSVQIINSYKTNKEESNQSIQEYAEGFAYYFVWIKHNPDSEKSNEQDKYGVVRNHWYELTVTKIKKLGYSTPNIQDPSNPDDSEKEYIQVLATIKKWTIVKQDVELQ